MLRKWRVSFPTRNPKDDGGNTQAHTDRGSSLTPASQLPLGIGRLQFSDDRFQRRQGWLVRSYWFT